MNMEKHQVIEDVSYYYHLIYDYIHGKFIDDNREETDGEPLEGTYAKALCPDMAVYP